MPEQLLAEIVTVARPVLLHLHGFGEPKLP